MSASGTTADNAAANWLESPNAKLSRAEHHLRDLLTASHEFFATDPYEILVEEHGGKERRRVRIHRQPPKEIALIAGDVIQNARASLDHLVCALAEWKGGKPAGVQRLSFPIRETRDDLLAPLEELSKDVGDEAVRLILDLQPYKKGDRDLWALGKLNNRDKHRVLFTLASSHARLATEVVPSITLEEKAQGKQLEDPFKSPPLVGETLVEDGALLMERPVKSDARPRLVFAIAFNEPDVAEVESVIATGRRLVDAATRVVEAFRRAIEEGRI